MKKKITLLSIGFVFYAGLIWGQSWSKTTTADNIPTGYAGTIGLPGQTTTYKVSAFEIKPDAAVINETNQSSIYPFGTLYSAYSLDFNEDLGGILFPIAQLNSVWFKATDPDGKLLMSKRVELPTSFLYSFQPPSGAFSRTHRDFLTINSLRYDRNDILVFTGSITGFEYNSNNIPSGGSPIKYETMVVGTYNLATNQIELEYLDSPTKVVCFASCNTYHIHSSGKGVNYLPEHELYHAIGVTMNYQNSNTFYKENPIAIVFEVDSKGAINIIKKEAFDFEYAPTEVDRFLTGHGTVSVGAYKPPTPYSTNCSGYPSAGFGLGVFNFKYLKSMNETRIGSYRVSYMPEFQINRSFPNTIDHPTIMQGMANETFVAFNTFPIGANNYSVIGKYDLDLSGSSFMDIKVEPNQNIVSSAFQWTDKNTHAQLVVNIVGDLGQKNFGSMGLIDVRKTSFQTSPLNVIQLFSEDYGHWSTNIRTMTNVTAVGTLPPNDQMDYYIADGLSTRTDYSRDHIYGISNQDFDAVCHEDFQAVLNPVCYAEESHENEVKWLQLNNSRYPIGNMVNYTGALVTDAHGEIFDCVEYRTPSASYKTVTSAEDISPEMISIEIAVKEIDRNVFVFEKGDVVLSNASFLDMNGRELEVSRNGKMYDLSFLPKGMYVVQLHFEDQSVFSRKLMVR
ncbi:hypothetical protein KFE98_07980 [bacterium SCSIO 12741]|nr:hypothetical protein KFE98_07980 [bacterium SCSIO 12741]